MKCIIPATFVARDRMRLVHEPAAGQPRNDVCTLVGFDRRLVMPGADRRMWSS